MDFKSMLMLHSVSLHFNPIFSVHINQKQFSPHLQINTSLLHLLLLLCISRRESYHFFLLFSKWFDLIKYHLWSDI